ncbi:tectonic-2 [Paragonimus westermani]|uniref:Tectonic-2 n=1 Tax=Paragonimus westermani TaxID=34504 RepID=A0A5J4NXT8_9TREM|nr:tectonic-2 [Paragonimus westermani]
MDGSYRKASFKFLNKRDSILTRAFHRFLWTSGSVTGAEAEVYLSDIPTNSTQTYNQMFTVTFTNQRTSTAQTEQGFPSSGRFGYDLNAPLITGTVENSNADNFTVSIGQVDTRVPGIVIPGPDYLCGNAGREPFRFRSNAVGACRVNLNLSDFENCIRLRSLLVSQLNQYVPENVVAVYGTPSTTASQDWVIVQRESAEINYTSPLENSVGTCERVPSGVLMDVFYAPQGMVQGQPIWQVIGAHVSYVYSTWTLRSKPTAEDSEVNLTSPSAASQAFYITISVAYTQVSTDWSDAIIRSPNASERRTLDIANELACQSDGCWKETFYAWNGYGELLSLDQGVLARTSYEVAAALTIGAITVTLMVVTRAFF